VSNELPSVSTVSVPFDVAVQRYQTECPPGLPAWPGSPASLPAPTVVPVTVPLAPVRTCADENASLAGGPVKTRLSCTAPTAPFHPSTAIRYVVPEVTAKLVALCFVEPETSSFDATGVSDPTAEPV
jgi:hypothetical protein